MKIELMDIAGLYPALNAVRLPFGKEPRSVDGKLDPKDVELVRKLVVSGDEHAKVTRGIVVWVKTKAPIYWLREMETYRIGHERLSCESTMHIDCKGLQGAELQKAKADMPMGKEQVACDMFSYQCLRHIYFQRKNHRLPEWKQFCEFIESLPFADFLITATREDVNRG